MTGPVSGDKDIARYASPSKINKKTGCEYHCGIKGLKYKDELIAELIAECVTECYAALAKPKISGC